MKRGFEKLFIAYAWASGLFLVGAVAGLIGYLFAMGLGSLDHALIFGDVSPLDALLLRRPVFDGLFPAIAGTIALVVLSVGIAVPVGVSAGIYMSCYAGPGVKRVFGLFFDILAGIPSIVIGLFGFSAAVFLHHRLSQRIYPCLLVSAFSLAFLVLPYLIRTTQTALENVPGIIRKTAPALGATRLQNIFWVLIPQSLSGIVSGVVLSIGRCAEDTAVIMLTGVVATAGLPRSLLAHYEALPFFIYYITAQYADADQLMQGYGAAVILMLICAVLFALSLLIKRFFARRLV